MSTILKKCPSCGKRFEVQRTSKSVAKRDEMVPEKKTRKAFAATVAAREDPRATTDTMRTEVHVEEEMEEDTDTETFKCRHCGHTWTETREKVKDLGEVDEAGQDV